LIKIRSEIRELTLFIIAFRLGAPLRDPKPRRSGAKPELRQRKTWIHDEKGDFRGWLDESGNTFQAPKRISEPETCDREFSDCPESASFNRRGAEKSNLLLGIRQGDEKGRGRREETQP